MEDEKAWELEIIATTFPILSALHVNIALDYAHMQAYGRLLIEAGK